MFGNHADHALVVTQEVYLETVPVNEINGIFDLGIRECEVVATDAIVNAISSRVQESHNYPPLAQPAAFWDDAESADMKGRKRCQEKRCSDPAKLDFPKQVLVHDLGILEGGLHVLGSGLEPSDA